MAEKTVFSNRLTARFTSIQGLFNISYCCILSFASVLMLARGFTNAQVGLTFMVSNGLSLVLQPAVSSFADRTRRFPLRIILAFFVAMTAAFSLLLFFAVSGVPLNAVLLVALSCLISVQAPLLAALPSAPAADGTPLNYSLARGLGSLAYSIASFSVGYLIDGFGAGVITLVACAANCLSFFFVVGFYRKGGGESAAKEAKPRPEASGFFRFLSENPRFLLVIVSFALFYFSHALINTFTVQIVRHVGGGNSDLGIVMSIAALLELPAMALFPRVLKKLGSVSLALKLSASFFIVKSLLTLFAPNIYWLCLAQSFQFFSYAMFMPASFYYVNEAIPPENTVKGHTCVSMSLSVCHMAASAVGGWLLDTGGGVPLMLTVGTVVTAAGLAMLLFCLRPGRARPDPGSASA